jgi:hypothetical protein
MALSASVFHHQLCVVTKACPLEAFQHFSLRTLPITLGQPVVDLCHPMVQQGLLYKAEKYSIQISAHISVGSATGVRIK